MQETVLAFTETGANTDTMVVESCVLDIPSHQQQHPHQQPQQLLRHHDYSNAADLASKEQNVLNMMHLNECK